MTVVIKFNKIFLEDLLDQEKLLKKLDYLNVLAFFRTINFRRYQDMKELAISLQKYLQ